MQPTISRETVLIDRRQPNLRWSAVIAGTACSVGFWMLLQLLGLGIGLAAIDVDEPRALHSAGISTTVWSLVSPLIAMFFGGLVAGKLAQTYERKVAGAHGLVMWAFTSILGLWATIWIVTMITAGSAHPHRVLIDPAGNLASETLDLDASALDASAVDASALDTSAEPGRDASGIGGDTVATINRRLSARNKPALTGAELDTALRGVIPVDAAHGRFDRERLTDQLVAGTRLSRADAADVARQVEARWQPTGATAHAMPRRAERYAAAATGMALATVGLSLLLSLVAAIAGAMLALHRTRRHGRGEPRRPRTTEPGYPATPVDTAHTTAPYPAPPPPSVPVPPPASPVLPPTDVTGP
ncbi:MAG TPA: hypothetical protein VFK02_22745 [Kofleriaceae bacterium]|nr:hypothetical protein [Kofleriaceae bacterium]